MKCPACGGKTGVENSRRTVIYGLPMVRRRRKCQQCGRAFYSCEAAERFLEVRIPGVDGTLKITEREGAAK